ncbi:MAG: hypothetical protein UW30_C0004G0034 [Candidatus Giovannonibacteria bacterium GW2011_GWA2_44_13b]|uniref:PrgI family protein n=1 Tax=Candidatus Giovannonibacteria bacterium GW2011_GWA2_44_13b TaxID=1618647 RepID=A0A0G1H4Y1_9BACT|nr:MAG: hypothetical protein UW30_C0004G0034 [Candidatus Giovannonibacteria bacterium GW2011_GWA2_44_13b]
MQHQVPQFIDVEDKIFGPLTAKQFFYVAAGGSIIFIMYVFFKTWLVIVIGIPIGSFFAALAFLKLNGVPFIRIVGNMVSYASSNRLFLWKKVPRAVKSEKEILSTQIELSGTKLTQNKLQDLSWSLDVQKNLNIKR